MQQVQDELLEEGGRRIPDSVEEFLGRRGSKLRDCSFQSVVRAHRNFRRWAWRRCPWLRIQSFSRTETNAKAAESQLLDVDSGKGSWMLLGVC
jgi:hypothetical protein